MADVTKISDDEFNALRDIMYAASGVRLLPTKKPLVISRLYKRLKELGADNFRDYLDRIKKPHSNELEIFVNAITTNETFFYRHPEQFHFLNTKILPAFWGSGKALKKPPLRIWSAGCSSGEEPYSISIACKEFFKERPGCKVQIFASDINSRVLDFCKKAVYSARSVSRMPKSLRKLYFDAIESDMPYKQIRFHLHRDIAQSVIFSQHNLLKPFLHENLDIIFLRNVMIYFDRSSKQKVIHWVEKNLKPGGYFFISLAESLNDIQTNLRYIHAGIYKKQ